jgi:hypothetical protein
LSFTPSERRSAVTKTNVGAIFASIAAILVAVALVAAFAVKPPVLGWVGFGIVMLIAFGLGAVATRALPRLRVSAPLAAVALDQERRLLVIADSCCSEVALCDEILARLDGAVGVHLVVPVRVSHLHFLTEDESDERRDAAQSMSISVGLLQRRGVASTGSVGTDKPLESMTDALGFFQATHVLLAIPPDEESYWLERGLLEKARALTGVAVTQVVIPPSAPAPRRVRVASGRRTAER